MCCPACWGIFAVLGVMLLFMGVWGWSAFAVARHKRSLPPPERIRAALRAASYPAVWEDLATQRRGQSEHPAECAIKCATACEGSPDAYVSEHCARICAAACGLDYA